MIIHQDPNSLAIVLKTVKRSVLNNFICAKVVVRSAFRRKVLAAKSCFFMRAVEKDILTRPSGLSDINQTKDVSESSKGYGDVK